MNYDSSDPVQVAKAEKDAEDLERDIMYIMKEPRGRRWIYTLIERTAHTNRVSHVADDPYSTAFNEGGRAIGLAVLEEIKRLAPNQYLVMMKELALDG